MDVTLIVVLVFAAVAVLAVTAGFFWGRSTAVARGRRPWLHRLLIGFLGLVLVAWPLVIGHVMWQVWPIVEHVAAQQNQPSGDGTDPATAVVLEAQEMTLLTTKLEVTPGQAYLLLVAVFGAAGAFIHTATSFATYLGNRKFKVSWGWWYTLRPLIGTGVALVLVAAILGGLVALTTETSAVNPSNLNPYTIAAFAALAGWFSKLVADKLEQILALTLSNAADRTRADGLDARTPEIESAVLEKTASGEYLLTLTGSDFTDGSTVTIDGGDRDASLSGDNTLVVTLTDEPSDGTVSVSNHSKKQSDPFEFATAQAAQAETDTAQRGGGGVAVPSVVEDAAAGDVSDER